jgi:hypothetical protein
MRPAILPVMRLAAETHWPRGPYLHAAPTWLAAGSSNAPEQRRRSMRCLAGVV